jgi:hypothetical protein
MQTKKQSQIALRLFTTGPQIIVSRQEADDLRVIILRRLVVIFIRLNKKAEDGKTEVFSTSKSFFY